MPQTLRKRPSKAAARSDRGQANGRKRNADAIALLKADHREVEGFFAEFEKTRSDSKKQDLATKICAALVTHTTIEEEIFYPAFYEATGEKDIHHEAEVEHEAAKKLIAEIQASGPDDDYFDAKVKVLSEMIKHHVNEEEKRGGMFAKARDSELDLVELGDELQRRKDEVIAAADDASAGRERKPRMPGAMARERNGRGHSERSTRRS